VEAKTFEAGPKISLDPSVPLVVLVDGGTASAAEIVAGALQANGRASVVGAPTVGKGAVTRLHPLPDQSALIVTVAHYVLAGGRVVEGQGITPDVEVGRLPPFPPGDDVEATRAWVRRLRQARREQMDRAVALLKEKLSPG